MPIERKSHGFGDTIAKFTAATNIDKVVKVVANLAGYSDCGCNERREALNKAFPYKNNQINNEQNKSSQ
jgi:hypothetical protein